MKSLGTSGQSWHRIILCPRVLEESILHIKMLILKEKDGFKTEVSNAILSVLFAFLSLL